LIVYGGNQYYGKSLNVEDLQLSWYDREHLLTYQSLHETETDLNWLHNSPVMIVSLNKYGKGYHVDNETPKLSNYSLNKFISADDIYNQIVNFLGSTKPFNDNRTDKEKILSNGFDLKTSFRH